jgi:hypothetical protein
MQHATTGEARHSFCDRTNENARQSAILGARIQRKRQARNVACRASKHALRDCEDCDDMARGALMRRFREAEREGTRIVSAGVALAPVTAPPAEVCLTPVQRAIIMAMVAVLSRNVG